MFLICYKAILYIHSNDDDDDDDDAAAAAAADDDTYSETSILSWILFDNTE